MKATPTVLLGLATCLVGCGGELDDPAAFEDVVPIRAIRPANAIPDTSAGPTVSPTPTPAGTAGAPAMGTGGAPDMGMGGAGGGGAGCDRALEIFNSTTCSGSACHGTPGSTAEHALPWVDLTFDQANLATRLSATTGSVGCEAYTVLNATTPEQSLLVTKLMALPPCGAAMPFNSETPLPAADRQCIIDWVTAAAQSLAP